MSAGNPFIWGQRSMLRGTKNSAGLGFLHSCECWLLPVLHCVHLLHLHDNEALNAFYIFTKIGEADVIYCVYA